MFLMHNSAETTSSGLMPTCCQASQPEVSHYVNPWAIKGAERVLLVEPPGPPSAASRHSVCFLSRGEAVCRMALLTGSLGVPSTPDLFFPTLPCFVRQHRSDPCAPTEPIPSKHETFTQCLFIVEPASQTLDQH